RSLSHGLDLVPATRAAEWHRLIGTAVVAAQPLRAQMHRQARVALRTGCDPSATRAEQRRCVAAAVEIDEHLTGGFQGKLDDLPGRACETRFGGVPSQVDEMHLRVARFARTFRQNVAGIASL